MNDNQNLSQMFIVGIGSARLWLLVLVCFSQRASSDSQSCIVKPRSGNSSSPGYVIRGCDDGNFKTVLANWALNSRGPVELTVFKNKMRSIQADDLVGAAIRVLHIQNNFNLQSVDDNFLRLQKVLEKLYINETGLVLDDVVDFSVTKNLTELNLSMKKMSENSLNNLPNSLERLVITKTKLGCCNRVVIEKKYKFLKSIFISRCNLKSFSVGESKALTHLDLSSNQLQYWQNLNQSFLPSLLFLNLQDNKLSSLDIGILTRFPSLEELILSGNRITKIPMVIFQHNPQLKYILNSNGEDADSVEVFLRSDGELKHIRSTKTATNILLYSSLSFLLGVIATVLRYCFRRTKENKYWETLVYLPTALIHLCQENQTEEEENEEKDYSLPASDDLSEAPQSVASEGEEPDDIYTEVNHDQSDES